MTDIIKKWIASRVGIVMNMTPEIFAADVMDGTLLSRILQSYNIIGHEQYLSIVSTDKQSLAFGNLTKLGYWLRQFDIKVQEQQLHDISLCKSTSAIRLFYQLYLELHDKNNFHFIVKKKIYEKLHPTENRFTIQSVEETLNDASKIPDNPLSEPLVLRNDVVNWNRTRYQTLLTEYDEMREKYTKFIEDKYSIIQRDKFQKVKCEKIPKINELIELNYKFDQPQDYTYDELVAQEKTALEMETFQEDPLKAKEITNMIRQKRRLEVRETQVNLRQQKVIVFDLWEKLINDQEKDFNEIISKKMFRQSLYEKRITTKMFEVRQQKQTMFENITRIDNDIMKKRDDEFLENVFLREKSVGDQKYNYYFERERALELHRRLYAEKLRLKAERNANMCVDVVNDIVDISIRHSEYKEAFAEEASQRVRNEWANLFIKQKPIFDVLEEVQDILQDTTDLSEEIQETYGVEHDRQSGLNEGDFENYFNLEWPWQLEDLLNDYGEDVLKIQMGMNILGHDVHRVLLTKYPKPTTPLKPHLPKVKVAACINSLPELTILPVLQKILNKKKVIVIDMQEAINYCLDIFNNEIRTEYKDNFLKKETENAAAKKKKPEKKKESVKSKKGSSRPVSPAINIKAYEEKEVQTPILFPCQEIVLSPPGELGKIAYDLLNIGEQLADILVVAMFIEYLKSLKDMEGWALINYPTNMEQAGLLEEALTGIEIGKIYETKKLHSSTSIGDVADLEYRNSQAGIEEKNVVNRRSKIVPNANPPPDKIDYQTYLTAYIRAQPKSDVIVENENEELIDPLEEFYTEQGCSYAFSYKTFDFLAIKHLAKLVIGEYSIPPKPSVELFGDDVYYIEANLGQGDARPGKGSKSLKKEKSKSSEDPKPKKLQTAAGDADKKEEKLGKGSKKNAKKKASVKSKMKSEESKTNEEVTTGIKEMVLPEIPIEIDEIEVYIEPKPGELLWRYPDLQISNDLQISLATLWENIESVYIVDFEQLFFIKRIILNAVVPYLTTIKKHMMDFIARPDDKQIHLHDFQVTYNEIDADRRDDDELKAEVHCRIAEFREKLWEICDKKMRESEIERQRIIKENWVAIQAYELTNNYITAMQLEIDRSCDSLQFLTDYYSGIITKMPSGEAPLQKQNLPRLDARDKETSETSIGEGLKDVFNNILIAPYSESNVLPFHDTLEDTLATACHNVAKWTTTSFNAVKSLSSFFLSKSDKKSKSASSKKGKKDKLPKFEPDPAVREEAPKLIQEWNCAIEGEFARVQQRLHLLKEKGCLDLNDLLHCARNTFNDLFRAARDRYNEEISSVDAVCEVVATAVEAETSIQPELVLADAEFYIQPSVLLYPNPLPTADPLLTECAKKGAFTVAQLDAFTNILINLAPNASIPERTFVYLLQDMIVHNAEDGKGPMVPPLWKKLQPNLVSKLSLEIFGDVEYLDWRDFIIYNLGVSFPSEQEILDMTLLFGENDPDKTETVKDYQFYHLKYWFESDFDGKDPQDMFRLKLIKQLLYKLYSINEDTFNYTNFLLAYCKDVNPVKGFAKALTLVLGQFVCWDDTVGTSYVNNVREERFIEKQMEAERECVHQEAIETAETVVDTVFDHALHVCDSVIIEDYVSVKDEENTETVSQEVSEEEVEENGSETSSLIIEEEFVNAEIGFQPHYNSSRIYFIPFEPVLTALTVSMPWHARSQTASDESFREKLEVIFETLRNSEFDNAVLAHELLNSRFFKEMLLTNFKFTEKYPDKIVFKLVEQSCGVCCL